MPSLVWRITTASGRRTSPPNVALNKIKSKHCTFHPAIQGLNPKYIINALSWFSLILFVTELWKLKNIYLLWSKEDFVWPLSAVRVFATLNCYKMENEFIWLKRNYQRRSFKPLKQKSIFNHHMFKKLLTLFHMVLECYNVYKHFSTIQYNSF